MRIKTKIWLVLMALIAIIPAVNAQTMLNNTYFTPIQLPKVTTDYLTDVNVGNGLTFTGQVYYSDGVISKYSGCLTNSAGDKFYSGFFNADFTVSNGNHQLYVPASHDVAYDCVSQNGSWNTVRTYDIKGKAFWVSGNQINFVDDSPAPSSGNYSSGNYSSGSSNGSSSNYNRHEAICRGCNGTGKCSMCNGTGWSNNNKYKCGRCHNTGRCQNCAGVGKKYGNF